LAHLQKNISLIFSTKSIPSSATLSEPAVYDLASLLGPGRSGCISWGAFMNFPVTRATESDQVALVIRAPMAPKSLVMNFDCGQRAAGLAPPTVALQDLFA
jgi:hypothetical protein